MRGACQRSILEMSKTVQVASELQVQILLFNRLWVTLPLMEANGVVPTNMGPLFPNVANTQILSECAVGPLFQVRVIFSSQRKSTGHRGLGIFL